MKLNNRKVKPRNPFHNHPLMRKGGAHEKTNKAKRKIVTQKLKKEWCYLIANQLVQSNNTIQWGSVTQHTICRITLPLMPTVMNIICYRSRLSVSGLRIEVALIRLQFL